MWSVHNNQYTISFILTCGSNKRRLHIGWNELTTITFGLITATPHHWNAHKHNMSLICFATYNDELCPEGLESPWLQIGQNKGWTSADRSAETTLVLTVPRSVYKSYANDLCCSMVKLRFAYSLHHSILQSDVSHRHCRIQGNTRMVLPTGMHFARKSVEQPWYRPVFSTGSGLEAFSRNPTHGSFSALACQPTEFTDYVTQQFLSY